MARRLRHWVETKRAHSAEDDLPNWKPINVFFTDDCGMFSVVDEFSAQKQATRKYKGKGGG